MTPPDLTPEDIAAALDRDRPIAMHREPATALDRICAAIAIGTFTYFVARFAAAWI